MKFVVDSSTFATELQLLSKIIAQKAPQPVLQNVLIEAGDELRMTTTDLEVGLRTTCEAQILERGAITLPVAKLSLIFQQLNKCDVTISLDKHHVFLSAGLFRSRIQTLPAKDFPTTPDVDGDVSTVAVSTLHEMIERTRYAIAEKDTKYMVNGALVAMRGEAAMMLTTDGKCLSMTSAPWTSGKESQMLIPSKTLDVLASLEAVGDLEVSEGDNHLFFVSKNRLLYSRMLEGKFPSFDRVTAGVSSNTNIMRIERVPFAAMLRRVSVMADDTAQTITFKTSSNLLSMSTRSAEMGDAAEELEADYSGAEIEVTARWEHMLDFLNVARGDVIEVALKDGDSPLKLSDGDDFINVILVSKRS